MTGPTGSSPVKNFLRGLEVQPPKGSNYAITQWVNPDLIPMDQTRRTWGSWKYTVYWATGGEQRQRIQNKGIPS